MVLRVARSECDHWIMVNILDVLVESILHLLHEDFLDDQLLLDSGDGSGVVGKFTM